MAEYQCICCGEVKQSQKDCICPNCGYKMYLAPYDRKQMLADEINRFLQCLQPDEIKAETVKFFRRESSSQKGAASQDEKLVVIPKSKDDMRFPDFDKIQGYVCAGRRSEEYFARLAQSLEEIKTHLHTDHRRCYEVDFSEAAARLEALDTALKEALGEIGLPCELEKAVFPKVVLDYRETPKGDLAGLADELLERLAELSAKVRKFIKFNNIYGTGYQRRLKPSLKGLKAAEDRITLGNVLGAVERVLAKKYEVDLFSDGSDELEEMLKVLWTAIYAVLMLPVLEKQSVYRFENGDEAIGDAFFHQAGAALSLRYAKIKSPVIDAGFMAAKDEDSLFDLYNKMIQLDSFGFMGVNAANLTPIGESEKALNRLIGLFGIKNSIQKIRAYAQANKGCEALNIHMCFYGNPGTGKTQVARIVAGILYENKILPSKRVVEVDRGGLVGQYVGETAQKTMREIQRAMGGVLFVDEAYALIPKDAGAWDYGQEAVATLIKAMEDHRGKFCVILAGYKNQMLKMLSTNPGFQSRIQFQLDFPNYTRGELRQIAERMLVGRKYTITDAAMEKLLDITDVKRKAPNFANAREVRNILDQVIMCQNLRAADTDDRELGIADVNRYITDAKINLPVSGEGAVKKILTGEEELDRLVGLGSVKRMVRKIKAYAKKNKKTENFNLHMCFCGNPGTGKTEIARILSRILYDAGVLAESKLVETDSTGLIGKVVGETGPKTQEKVQEAMGGVLFIDEAYGLSGGSTSSPSANYGDEAIAVLLKEMEDHRGQFCVILAGYQEEMKDMLRTNPGFESRIQFKLDFPDYTREELGEIAVAFLKDKKYEIDPQALDRILDVTEYYRQRSNFANARTVRNILDQVIMNQNLRTEADDHDRTLVVSDVEDYIKDLNLDLNASPRRRIGFGIDTN